ncbi:MAG TPA: carboxypeptidase-like regulatory domain-containing protein [Thermoanaerobaculia bacterium]|nr:carboxypeptidase-like regulatory domain-containing protein [Thermoanaerobaculia bacterium]
MLWPRVVAAVAVLLLVSAVAPAQPAASSLTGRVTSGGAPLRGAAVTVRSPSLLGERSATTGAGGGYFLRALPPGLYDVTFTAEGTQTLIRRVELNVAETSRLDAELARRDVEETVTRTTLMPTLLETPQLATTIDAATADRLPIGRSIAERIALAPGLPPRQAVSLIDGVVLAKTVEEAMEETTFVTGGLSAEYAAPELIATVTRRRGGDVYGSLRAAVSSGQRRLFEAAGGGTAIEERLWLFGAGSDGQLSSGDQRRAVGRLTARIGAAQTVEVSRHEGWSGRYDGIVAPNVTLDGLVTDEQWSMKGHMFLSTLHGGSHSIVAGAEDLGEAGPAALFINDSWRGSPRWSFNLGLRHADGAADPRLGAVYDAWADGEHRIGATWGRFGSMEETTLTYGWRFGVGGYARADYIRRSAGEQDDLLQIHGVYDLFRLFRFGGNHTARLRGSAELRNRTNLWFWFEPALGDGRLTLALLQRHQSDSPWSTDLSSMVTFPAASVTAFAKIDLLDAFDDRDWRAAVGVRF